MRMALRTFNKKLSILFQSPVSGAAGGYHINCRLRFLRLRNSLVSFSKKKNKRRENMKKYYGLYLVLILSLVTGFHSGVLAKDLISPNVTVIDDYTIKGPKHFNTGYEPGDAEGNATVVIEIPKGTTGKWEVSLQDGTIIWEFKKGKPRVVTYKGGYIVNYGSIPQTTMPESLGGDGEPLDVVVLGAPIPRGEVVKVKLIGVLNLMEDGDFDGKLIAVKKGSPEFGISSIAELNAKHDNVVNEVTAWFENYKGPDSGLKIDGIGTAEDAMDILIASIEAYKEINR
jgi:inorganic pyrophosphatase